MSSFSLLHSQCLSYSHCRSRARPGSLIPRTILVDVGHTPSGLGFISGHPCVANKGISIRQRFNNRRGIVSRAKKQSEENVLPVEEGKDIEEEVVEEEREVSWIQEKAEDLVEFTGTVTQAIPGPRVGQTKMPWLLAVPLAYMGLTFVIAVIKTVRKLNSPKAKKRRLVNKNAMLCRTLDELILKQDELDYAALEKLMRKTGFSMEEILRKYIRYALNEKPFNPDLVANLIHLRKSSMLEDDKVAEVLNEVSRRIVKDKGPVVMDTTGFTERGIKRKVAVQALFSKLLYLAELDEFCSTSRSSLNVKEFFGVTDEDANALRIETLSEEAWKHPIQGMEGYIGTEAYLQLLHCSYVIEFIMIPSQRNLEESTTKKTNSEMI